MFNSPYFISVLQEWEEEKEQLVCRQGDHNCLTIYSGPFKIQKNVKKN